MLTLTYREEAAAFDPIEYFQTLPETVDRVFNRPRVEQLSRTPLPAPEAATRYVRLGHSTSVPRGLTRRVCVARRSAAAYKELELRAVRASKLGGVKRHLELQKQLMVRLVTYRMQGRSARIC